MWREFGRGSSGIDSRNLRRYDLYPVRITGGGATSWQAISASPACPRAYLVHLYAKELIMRNFAGLPADQLLERMVELSLRTEEHL
jgi:hypothetical protein